jgi:hypothetical protein
MTAAASTLAQAGVREAAAAPGPGRLIAATALLALWLGAALLTAAVVAPAAFAVLPTRALAGALVGRVLPVIFVGGLAAGATAAFLGGAAGPFGRGRLTLAVATAALCAVAQFGVTPRLQSLRAELGPDVEAVARTDPRRQAFGRLHGVSVLLMGAAGLAAGGALVLAAIAATRRAP